MDIRSGNIKDNIDSIKKHIFESDFVAISLDVTSHVDKIEDESLDTSQKRYDSLKDKYSNYGLIQIGICPFKFENDRYSATPYNISSYQSQLYYDRSFLLDPDLLESKRKENFDINEWIDKSLTFIPKSELEALLKKISEDKERKKSHTLMLTVEEKEALTNIFELIDMWNQKYQNPSNEFTDEGDVEPIPFTDDIGHEIFSTSNNDLPNTTSTLQLLQHNKSELVIPEDILKSSVRIQSIHQEINKKYPELLTEYSQKEQKFIVKRINEVENQIRSQQEVNLIIDYLIESDKPIVGYNLMFQLMLLYQYFINELPIDYKIFKDSIHTTFPKLIDTRYIEIKAQSSKKYNFESNNKFDDLLNAILTSMDNQKIDIALDEHFQRYDLNKYYTKTEDGEKPSYFNEAGFKALINGACFTNFGLLAEKSNRNSNVEQPPHYSLLKHINHVFYFDWEFRLYSVSRGMSSYSASTKKRKRKAISKNNETINEIDDYNETPSKFIKYNENELLSSENQGPISNRTRASNTPASKVNYRENITTSKKRKKGTRTKKESIPMEPLDEMEEVMQTPKNNVKKTRSHTTNKKATTNKRATSSRSRNTKVEEDLTTPRKKIEEDDTENLNENPENGISTIEESPEEKEKEGVEEYEKVREEIVKDENNDMEVEREESPKKLKDYPECTIS